MVKQLIGISNSFRFRGGVCLLVAALISGCSFPSAPEIKVTVRSADGEEAEGEDSGDDSAAGGDEAETVEGYGTFSGRVIFTDAPPNLPVLIKEGDSSVKDAAVCSAQAVPDESIEVDPATKGIKNVVLYLAKAPKHINPDLSTDVKPEVVFDQKGCKFFPHILPVRVDLDQTLVVKSDDPIAHNTHVFAQRNSSLNSAVNANDREGIPVNYTRAESEPIRVVCDLHSWMKAYHFPIDHPYYAVTNEDGTFTIEGLPAGKHEFKVWQERSGLLERKLTIEIEPDGTTEKELSYDSAQLKL